jgi:hypothetical protein
MINAVLNAIPIFYLSFLKMPNKVWKKVVRIQREFLWGGVKGGKKISWVKWSVVCRDRKKGGLGVRDVRLVNLSLLAKWRWRLLLPDRALWKDVLVAKYGGHILTDVDWSNYRLSPKASNWWKVIALLDNVVPDKSWLSDSIYRKVGNGISTSFWNSKWVGDATLAVVFPRLYSLSNVKDCLVSDILVGGFDLRVWPFSWRRDLFQWEEERLVVLKELLESVTLSGEVDVWCWSPDKKREFSVKSAYNLLVSEFEYMEEEDGALVKILDHIWESLAPSKVIAFSWQLLYDRIPSRCNLRYRGVVLSDIPWECVGCVGTEEDTTHLFLHCPSAMLVLREIFKWIGVFIIIPPSIPSLFVILKGWRVV